MGEVGLIDGDVVVLEEIGKEEEDLKKETNVVTWESLVPRMFLRVLLVEGDDSTRQIITALLQKCNYKGVSFSLSFCAYISLFLRLNYVFWDLLMK